MKMSGHTAREFSATWKAADPKPKVMAALATATKTGKRKSRHTSEMRAFNSIGLSLNGGHSRRESKSAELFTVASSSPATAVFENDRRRGRRRYIFRWFLGRFTADWPFPEANREIFSENLLP
jgi:hypothetical protein